MHFLSQFLLGILLGWAVSIPIGPFGIWALRVFIRQGRLTTIRVALGGVIGDSLIVIAYVVGGSIARLYSIDPTHIVNMLVMNEAIRGLGLVAVGCFLVFAAVSKTSLARDGRFITSFVGAIAPGNMFFVGFILSSLGVESEELDFDFAVLLTGFMAGGLSMWLGGVKVLSMWKQLIAHLNAAILVVGCISILLGVWNVILKVLA